mgnify:CR=1 FL=1|tara:strand:- start:6494 stop:6742 length:249 start_codon:yes stop_codon:yes gene_type:complete
MRTLLTSIAILTLSQIGMAQDKAEVQWQTVIEYREAIDPEAIILIEDMIEYTEWDIQGGMIDKHIGKLLLQNLEDLKAKLKD